MRLLGQIWACNLTRASRHTLSSQRGYSSPAAMDLTASHCLAGTPLPDLSPASLLGGERSSLWTSYLVVGEVLIAFGDASLNQDPSGSTAPGIRYTKGPAYE